MAPIRQTRSIAPGSSPRAGRLAAALAAVAVLWLALVANPARAEPSAADKETARAFYAEGNRRLAAGDYRKALKAYEAADAVMAVPTTGYKVGLVRDKLGLLVEALDVVLRVGRYPREPDESEPFREARRQAAELAARLRSRIPSVIVHLDGLPPGQAATVRIDGWPLPAQALGRPYKVNPGKHAVVASARGFADSMKVVTVPEGTQQAVRLRLVSRSAAASTQDRAPERVPALGWVGLGVAATGLVMGTVTGIIVLSEESHLADACPEHACPADRQGDLDRAVALSHVSTASFLVGGAGLATSVLAVLLLGGEPAEGSAGSEAAARVVLGPAAVGLSGRF